MKHSQKISIPQVIAMITKLIKKVFADEIKMMYEFIEFKYFKKVMKQNNNIFE